MKNNNNVFLGKIERAGCYVKSEDEDEDDGEPVKKEMVLTKNKK